MDENSNGKFCPRGCDCIPEVIEDSFSQDTTIPYAKLGESPCCAQPELEPFELHNGTFAQHCWTCGKIQ